MSNSQNNAPKTILVVDDDRHVLDLMVEVLREAGYEVRGARDGQSALQMAAESRPHLCLLDYRLPGINGLELFDRLFIRCEGQTRAIMLSGTLPADEELEKRAIVGVSKPCDIDQILLLVNEKLLSTSTLETVGNVYAS